MDEKKRQKVMLIIMGVLIIVVVLNIAKKKMAPTGSLMDAVTGGDINSLVNSYDSSVDRLNIILQEKLDFDTLEQDILTRQAEFWSYSKSGSPRGDIQQRLRNLAKSVSLDDMRVSIGFERTVSGCEYLKMIDFSVSSRNFDMKRLTEFFELVDKEQAKFFWNECKIYMSGKTLAFSGSIRVYVFTNKAIALLGKK
jgi:hypothetical protein